MNLGIAGTNPFKIAKESTKKAFYAYIFSAALVIFPLYFRSDITSFSRYILKYFHIHSITKTHVFMCIFCVFCILSYKQYSKAKNLLKVARNAKQGANAEVYVSQMLQPLQQQGWRIEYGALLPKVGDIDIICLSPNRNVYAIDVKSHKCDVMVSGDKLLKVVRNQIFSFEKDFLYKSMQQALALKHFRGLRYVTPILTFTHANVLLDTDKIKGVHVVESANLVNLLINLG